MERKWTLAIHGGPGEHRVFKDEFSRYAIADESGRTPDETDDGALFIVAHEPIHLVGGFSHRVSGQVTVRKDDGKADGYTVWVGPTVWPELARKLGMRVLVNGFEVVVK